MVRCKLLFPISLRFPISNRTSVRICPKTTGLKRINCDCVRSTSRERKLVEFGRTFVNQLNRPRIANEVMRVQVPNKFTSSQFDESRIEQSHPYIERYHAPLLHPSLSA